MTTTKTEKKRTPGPAVSGGGRDARQVAAAILEVLGGARTPQEAADALGISCSYYFVLEIRALEGLVAACEPKPKGRQRTPDDRIAELERDLHRTKRECARHQALLRATRRTVGLTEAPDKKDPGKGRKSRTTRALKAAARLVSGSSSQNGGAKASPAGETP